MAKTLKTLYQCTECGGTSPKWQGKCPHCGEWNTLQESLAAPEPKNARFQSWAADTSTVQSLSAVTATEVPRNPTGMGELDRVLGGGLVDGAVILLGGDPGIGKSTLLLQTIAKMAQSRKVLYVSGEESAQQVALRAQRLELPTEGVNLLAEIRMEAIQTALKQHQPEVVVIDSIQTMYSDQITSAPGSVSQVRECAAQLTRMAKQMGIAMILVGHVTKDGAIAGPRVLEHMVDTVLYFEGDQHSNYRMIRAIKNRFGAANELGVFAMTENGLKGVSNPSAIFLASYRDDTPGSCVLVTQEGSRPLLVEIQALVDDAHGFTPKRLTVGLEQNRLAMLLAVLNRHGGIACFDQDVFLNAVGGVKIGEPAGGFGGHPRHAFQLPQPPAARKNGCIWRNRFERRSPPRRAWTRADQRGGKARLQTRHRPQSQYAAQRQRVSEPENIWRFEFAGSHRYLPRQQGINGNAV